VVALAVFERTRFTAARAYALAAAVLVPILPVYRYFFISADMENARYLYLASSVWALGVACLAADHSQRAWIRLLRSGLLVAVGVAFLSAHLARQSAWVAASVVRDTVLTHVANAITERSCREVTVRGLPDSVNGVFVFRNGFDEAVRRHGALVSAGRPCSGEWTGAAFVLDPPPGTF
jgi:hypothetical protein